MPEEIDELSALEPFEIVKRAEETGGEFVRVEVTLHPFPDGKPTESDLAHRRWIVDGIGEHFHPRQEEYFHVQAGELHVVQERTERTLTAGEEIALPANVPHSHWNPADRPARVAVEHRPACQSDKLLETLYVLAQTGRTDEAGVPNVLQSMVLQKAYADHAYRADRPVSAQKALATLFAPIGRLAGYESVHSVEEIEALERRNGR